ncbi:MAG: lamin tail domain-containing protein, partial [Phaeodactylibacter sp.]|nr:lamin tail domain-containing protein [Phaeodactylibacter sp.]
MTTGIRSNIFLSFVCMCLCFFSHAQIIFTEINFNPTCPFDDCEYVEIKNNGSNTIDISGWQIVDNASTPNVFTFPATTIISPGEYIVIADDDLAFNAAYPGVINQVQVFFGVPPLNNSPGDVLQLLDDGGGVQASASYLGNGPGNGDGNSLNLESESPTGEPPSPGNIQGSLPIKLISFSAAEKIMSIHLSWRTATEQNNDYMAVERSADGAKFTELGRVKGAGTTHEPQEYTFI